MPAKSSRQPPPSGVPPNPSNKGIMDSIRKLKVGQFIEALITTRNRFYTDFARLGWKCSTRLAPKDRTKIRVYRTK